MRKLVFVGLTVLLVLGVARVGLAEAAGQSENQEFIQVAPQVWTLSTMNALEDIQIHVAVSVNTIDRDLLAVTIDGTPAEIDSVGVDSWGDIAIHISPLDEGFVFVPGSVEIVVTHDGELLSDGEAVSVIEVPVR